MDTFLYFSFCIAYLWLLGWGIFIAKEYGWLKSANLVMVVIAALLYDNGILAVGRYIGEGSLLKQLNYIRFYLHAFFTPMLVVFAWSTLKHSGIRWAQKHWVRYVSFLIFIGLVILELTTVIRVLKLEVKWEYGVLSYESIGKQGEPPWMVIIVTAILLFASIIVWRKQKWTWFVTGVGLMIIGGFLMSRIESGTVMNAFELILMISLLATKRFQESFDR